MKIGTRLSATSSVSLGMVLVMLATLGYSFLAMRKANADLALAVAIRATLFDMIVLRDDYYVRREERARTQWAVKDGLLSAQLSMALKSFTGEKVKAAVAAMIDEQESSGSIFRKLAAGGAEGSLAAEYDKRLFSQLLIKSYLQRDDAAKLEEMYRDDLAALRSVSDWFLAGSLTIVVALVLVNGAMIGKILTKGIRGLQRGASSIGGGNLETRIEIDSEDEIADLAREINSMASSLSKSFTSIVNLEREAALRMRAEDEVRSLNADLERRVAARTAQLEAANDELEDFAFSVSHYLRAPLRTVTGFARAFLEDFGQAMGEEALRRIIVINEAAARMDRLIRDILSLSRVGRFRLQVSPIDMRAMAIAMYHETASKEELASIRFSLSEIPEAEGDPILLRQVWGSLFSNAIKFSRGRDDRAISVGADGAGDDIRYIVEDNGIGFEQANAGKIFNLFQRLHGMETYEGTGVGLALAKRIVERHGGRIGAESRVGEGAMFWFSLPPGAPGAKGGPR